MEHTKIPWKAERSRMGFQSLVYGADGRLVATVEPDVPGNTDLIVRAVNAFEPMLEALRQMTAGKCTLTAGALHESGRFCRVCGHNGLTRLHSLGCPVEMAEAAIAKVMEVH